jgi:3-hydroxyisobutyrate dehydrogenase
MSIETPVGVAGAGRMGAAIARRLLSLGCPVVVWNRDRDKTAPLAEEGARVAETPAALARECPTTISMLFDAAAAEAVYLGADGLLSGDPSGRLFVDMSTIGPDAAVAIGAVAAAKGADFVECPVGGTVGPAREGKLLGLAGGAPEAFGRARPLLERLCRRLVHAGPVGAGARLKLAVNLPLLVYWEALGEALGLAAGLDLEPADLCELMADTSGAPAAMKMRHADVARLIGAAGEGPAAAFELRGGHKDLSVMVALAEAEGVEAPVARAARDAYARAVEAGRGGDDAMAMGGLAYRSKKWGGA